MFYIVRVYIFSKSDNINSSVNIIDKVPTTRFVGWVTQPVHVVLVWIMVGSSNTTVGPEVGSSIGSTSFGYLVDFIEQVIIVLILVRSACLRVLFGPLAVGLLPGVSGHAKFFHDNGLLDFLGPFSTSGDVFFGIVQSRLKTILLKRIIEASDAQCVGLRASYIQK